MPLQELCPKFTTLVSNLSWNRVPGVAASVNFTAADGCTLAEGSTAGCGGGRAEGYNATTAWVRADTSPVLVGEALFRFRLTSFPAGAEEVCFTAEFFGDGRREGGGQVCLDRMGRVATFGQELSTQYCHYRLGEAVEA